VLPPWTPDLGSLELLLAVAETGSIAQAATANGISQPSASVRLARLERRVGVTLLVRTTSGTSLTPIGQAFATWAREVVAAAKSLTDGVSALRASTDARLSVAASLTVAEYLLPTWLVALRRHRPDLEVAATVANSHDVADLVRSGAVDLGFLESPDTPDGVTSREIDSDEVVLVVASSDPLAGSSLPAADVPSLSLLLREPGSGTRDTFLHALATALGKPTAPALAHATTLGSTATILAATRAGGGVGVVSARAVVADVAAGMIARIAVEGLSAVRPLTAVWLGRAPTPLARELIAIAAD